MTSFALRYAHAFHQVAKAQNLNQESVRQQLDDFAESVAESRELREFMVNPSLPHTDKLKVLDALGAKIGLDHAVRNFLAVIIDHHRIESLDDIVAEYKAVADEASSIVEAEIVSARPLSEQDRNTLQQEAERLSGTSVRTTWREDSSILGGVIMRLGSDVYDGSVRGQLKQLQQHLAGAQ